MKFEILYGNTTEKVEYGLTLLRRDALHNCRNCGALTRWHDVLLDDGVCSEDCYRILWTILKDNEQTRFENFEHHFDTVRSELKLAYQLPCGIHKDIIIVVRDQLDYVKECIESVKRYTTDFSLYLWDNGSRSDTHDYLKAVARESHVYLQRSENNMGFIEPNNLLADLGNSEYLILLNSDCRVWESWDKAMIAYLRQYPEVLQVGYWGGFLDEQGIGFGGSTGYKVDYIPGWCFCISRQTYERFGLFDPKLHFAYAEDADLSLRLKEAGGLVYALYSGLVYHHQNKTVNAVNEEGEVDLKATFEHNRMYLVNRWQDYLRKSRVGVCN